MNLIYSLILTRICFNVQVIQFKKYIQFSTRGSGVWHCIRGRDHLPPLLGYSSFQGLRQRSLFVLPLTVVELDNCMNCRPGFPSLISCRTL